MLITLILNFDNVIKSENGVKRFDLLNHPVRLRIAYTLFGQAMTTNQLHAALGDVPKASLYRHLQRMLEGGVLEVVETRTVNGIEERIYTTAKQELYLTDEDLKRGVNNDDFAEFIRIFGAIAFNEIASVIESQPELDVKSFAIRQYDIFATEEEFAELRAAIWRLLDEAQQRPHTSERKAWRWQVVGFPPRLPNISENEGDENS